MGQASYVKKIIDDYCVLDTETTGLSAYYDEIIEIGMLKVRKGEIVGKCSQLIEPRNAIDPFITELTGISNEMVAGMPHIEDVQTSVMNFLGHDVIVGHNTSFDIRFLNSAFHDALDNEYMDTMQFSKKLFPELKHHRLSDMAELLKLTNNEHRALADCITTYELYESIKNTMNERHLGISDLWAWSNNHNGIDIQSIRPDSDVIDKNGFFYGKHVVFTGKLEKMSRKDAMQIVVNLGGILDAGVTKTTNYLILGNNDYNTILHGEKSAKHKKAEQLKLKGQDIDIIDELTFYDLAEIK